MRPLLRRAAEAFLTLLYPPHCTLCRAATSAGEYLCPTCQQKARTIDPPMCERCSQPFDGALDAPFTCSNCADLEFHFQCAVARYRSTGAVRELIHRFKYDRAFYLRHPLAAWLADGLQDPRIQAAGISYLVPVPLHTRRQREREFNQADELARLLAPKAGVPVLHCLERVRYTTTQTRLNRAQRMQNLRGAFHVRHTARVSESHLLLVDDVFTTGSTVEECARVLKQAGAASVRVLTVARG